MTLFTSMMHYYYDVNSASLFDDLFKDTYVYNNLTLNKNNYYVLKFDFSGMEISANKTDKELEESFKICVIKGMMKFLGDYNLEYEIERSLNASDMLKMF